MVLAARDDSPVSTVETDKTFTNIVHRHARKVAKSRFSHELSYVEVIVKKTDYKSQGEEFYGITQFSSFLRITPKPNNLNSK